ncbi:MAG: basic secretory protein-like protein [Candidatus Nanoarchaeia archaeon]|nr:basic secretory protein-like protein [Candidatus Nanoarchaeia archaeon]
MKLKTIIIISIIILMFYGCSYIGNKLPQRSSEMNFKWNITSITNEINEQWANQTSSSSFTRTELPAQKDGRFEGIMEVDCTKELCETENCIVKFGTAPEMQDFAKKVASICEIEYPKIKERIRNQNVKPPYRFIINKTLEYAGYELDSEIYLNAEYFAKNPGDLGSIVHEMTHVIQQYDGDYPSWVCEGIADYMRAWLGYNELGAPRCSAFFPNYTSGYQCAAALFEFIGREYNAEIITKLDEAMRHNSYSDSIFYHLTGKTLEELWQECREKDCKLEE